MAGEQAHRPADNASELSDEEQEAFQLLSGFDEENEEEDEEEFQASSDNDEDNHEPEEIGAENFDEEDEMFKCGSERQAVNDERLLTHEGARYDIIEWIDADCIQRRHF